MLPGLHALLWILTYSAALAAFVLAAVLARRQPGLYPRRLRSLLLVQLLFAALVSALYQLDFPRLLGSLPADLRAVISISANGIAYAVFALFVSLLPGVFRQDATPSLAGRIEGTARWLVLALAVVLAAMNIGLALRGAPASKPLLGASTAGWVGFGILLCALVGWAGVEAFLDTRRLPLTRPAAVLFVALFYGFLGLEVLPGLGSLRRGQTYYFLLPSCLDVLSVFLGTVALRLLATQNAEAGQHAEERRDAAEGAARPTAGPGYRLSPREKEIASLLAEGKAYKEIAFDLHVGLSTIQTHVFRIYSKLAVNNKVELANRLRA